MRCRENRSYGDFDACFLHALAKLIICAADCVLTFHVSSPYRLVNARRLFDCVSFTVYRSSYYHTVLNADGRVHTVTCLCLFYRFLTQCFTPFYNCAFLFTAYSFFSFIPIFTRTSFIVLNFILLRASLDATISLFVSVFIRLNLAQRQASYHSYTSLLPLFIYHAYFVQCRMVSS